MLSSMKDLFFVVANALIAHWTWSEIIPVEHRQALGRLRAGAIRGTLFCMLTAIASQLFESSLLNVQDTALLVLTACAIVVPLTGGYSALRKPKTDVSTGSA